MKVEVEVIHRDLIKPSSPTPPHLQHYQLSFLDQINPAVFMPLVLFYPNNPDSHIDNAQKSTHLKNSLSECLTKFYPLAGRVVNNNFIDCSDIGVPYVEARANCQLSDVITNPIPKEFNKFLPCDLNDVRDLLAVVQITFFECGGVAVAACLSHKIADAMSSFTFINGWATTAHGETDVPLPQFKGADFFPPMDTTGFIGNEGIFKDNIVTKRFVFSASKIVALQEKFSDNTFREFPRRPSRIEALSAFIWARMTAIKAQEEPNKIYALVHAVNLRPRTDPPLPDHVFGNFSRFAMVFPSMDGEINCQAIISQMKNEIKKINGDYVNKLREGASHLSSIKDAAEKFTKGELISFNFTSMCRFPLCVADFGWGKPMRAGSARLTFKNFIVFMDAPTEGGIEAWVSLEKEDMEKFEMDKEFLGFVSASPDEKKSRF
ncbi:stemmadenine O-acetyltransferase-like [Actinidia eriantha]|uniref:stemmadenine O-acetyltransferase-like n=1 Tax=Actinidia eriantha TaxID=165200 RepID=UPI00258918A1|nr:stemmadenine O-acetyltransferase-like [Actinidia eriantha]XP_057508661.1 stemmadenine O-acetyltransferase-like [Actinidia eriantha]